MASSSSYADSTPQLPDYVPVPEAAFGPALNEQGYFVGRVERNLFWVTDGTYQSAFLATPDGVVLFDAPPTIGHNLRRAVDEVAAAEGIGNTVTHLVYSHHHADHAGAANLFGDDIVRIGHAETRRLLLRDNDATRPAPEVTFEDRYTLQVGGERVELAYHGPNHSPDNIFIHFPDHDALMLIDIVNSGWVPIYNLNLSEDVPGYIDAPGPGPGLPVEALHRRSPRPARHPRRPGPAPAVHRRHRRQLARRARLGRPDPVLRQVRRERLGRGGRLPRRRHRASRRAGHRQVHRRPGGGRRPRVHHQHHLHHPPVDPPRPRHRLAGPPVTDG